MHKDRDSMIIFPDHGGAELGKGLQLKIMKQAGLKE
jgi:predicted RNA binding protein YcfA (HicA-like mRNA interferase family)